MQSQKQQNDLCFQGKPFIIMVIQVYAPTSNADEAEVEQFCEDLQDLLVLTFKKHVLLIIGDWNAKVGSQEIPGVTGKFGLGVQNEAGQRLIEFCQETALVIANTHTHTHTEIKRERERETERERDRERERERERELLSEALVA